MEEVRIEDKYVRGGICILVAFGFYLEFIGIAIFAVVINIDLGRAVIAIIIFLMMSVLLFYLTKKYYKHSIAKRIFIVNQELIKIQVPNLPEFVILWQDIDQIEITKTKEYLTSIYVQNKVPTWNLAFITKEGRQCVFKLQKYQFHKKKIEQIIFHIEEYASKGNKKIINQAV